MVYSVYGVKKRNTLVILNDIFCVDATTLIEVLEHEHKYKLVEFLETIISEYFQCKS